MANPTVMQTSRIVNNKIRPRRPSETQVKAMIDSIQAMGRIIKPIDVRPVSTGYEIVDGEIRWLAAKALKIDIVPINVLEIDQQDSTALALIENLHREELNPVEVVSGLESLVAEFGVNTAEIVSEQMIHLQQIATESSELQARINVLLGRCGISQKV